MRGFDVVDLVYSKRGIEERGEERGVPGLGTSA